MGKNFSDRHFEFFSYFSQKIGFEFLNYLLNKTNITNLYAEFGHVNSTVPQLRVTFMEMCHFVRVLSETKQKSSLLLFAVDVPIWATSREKVSSNMLKRHKFRFIPRMRKVSSGHLLSIDTFYSVK